MTRIHGLTRSLATALAFAALAAPAAVAKPVDQPRPGLHAVAPVNALGTDVGAPDQQAPAAGGQDLRSPDAQAPAVRSQDLRSPDAADTSRPLSPQPAKSSPVQDGTPWSAIGLGLAGVCLALAGVAVTAGRIRRRTGVAA